MAMLKKKDERPAASGRTLQAVFTMVFHVATEATRPSSAHNEGLGKLRNLFRKYPFNPASALTEGAKLEQGQLGARVRRTSRGVRIAKVPHRGSRLLQEIREDHAVMHDRPTEPRR